MRRYGFVVLIWCSFSLLNTNVSAGRHHIRYAIFPHRGPLDSKTVRAGYNFNNPMRLIPGPGRASLDDITLTGNESLILDAIKRGEDDEDVSLGDFNPRKGQHHPPRV